MSVACAVVVRQGKVLVQKRLRKGDYVIEFPMGRLDGDESFEQAAIRELLEETGLRATLAAAPVTILHNEQGRAIGFVLLNIADDAVPQADARRKQEFLWHEPKDIPLVDFHALDVVYVMEYLPKLIREIKRNNGD